MMSSPANDSHRVLQILTRDNVGGPARLVASLAKGLPADFALAVAAGMPEPSEGTPVFDAAQIPVERLPLRRSIAPKSDLAALVRLRRLVAGRTALPATSHGAASHGAAWPPDLVHTHMAKAGALTRLAALGVQNRPVLVHTYHGHVFSGYFPAWQVRSFVTLERLLAKTTDALVAVSPEVRDELLSLGIGRPEQWHVVVPGVELAAFLEVPSETPPSTGSLRKALGVQAGTRLVGMVGRLVPVKDHLTAFRALEHLPEVHLALIGDGELRQALSAEAGRLGIGPRVHFTGWVEDVPAVLAELDVVVLSSRNEGTPLALIEAAAAARPVVATDVGGVASVVVDGRTGCLVPPSRPEALAAALRRLLDDPAERLRLGEAARAHAVRRFGDGRMVQETLDLYRTLLSRHN
jgi:glycosyltransferase involved in cell wall biosynthesis